jgi:hypothetical protein
MAFHAVYKRHTPFAFETVSCPVFNGVYKVQKVGDVLLYAYLYYESEFPSQIQSISLFIGGQEIDTWDDYYLNVLNPVLMSKYNGYTPQNTTKFLPIPIPMLPLKNMRYHDIEFVVKPAGLPISIHMMQAWVDETIPDGDILYHRVFRQSIRPNIPFSVYGAVKYIASSDFRLDTIRFEREYTVLPLRIAFTNHSSTKTRDFVGAPVLIPIPIRVIHATLASTNEIQLYGYDTESRFGQCMFDILRETCGEVTPIPIENDEVLKVVGTYIVCRRSIRNLSGTLIETYSDDIIDGYMIDGRLFIIFRRIGFQFLDDTLRNYTFERMHYSTHQINKKYIISYTDGLYDIIDTVTLQVSGNPPTPEISEIISIPSTQLDQRDTFEAGRTDEYYSREEGGLSKIYYQSQLVFTCPANGYRTLVDDRFYIYFFSIATNQVIRIPKGVGTDSIRIKTLIPFCTDTNSSDLTGYRWFSGEDIRINASGMLYIVVYTILSVRNGMASLRF